MGKNETWWWSLNGTIGYDRWCNRGTPFAQDVIFNVRCRSANTKLFRCLGASNTFAPLFFSLSSFLSSLTTIQRKALFWLSWHLYWWLTVLFVSLIYHDYSPCLEWWWSLQWNEKDGKTQQTTMGGDGSLFFGSFCIGSLHQARSSWKGPWNQGQGKWTSAMVSLQVLTLLFW